jgi:hypothetical protein
MSQIQTNGDGIPVKPPVIGYATPTMAPTFAVVWCRILSLWMLAWGLESATSFVASFVGYLSTERRFGVTSSQWPVLLVEFLPGIVWLLIAWYFWRKAPAIALRMTRGHELSPSPRGMAPDELLSIITIGIGIYLLTVGLTGVAQAVIIAFDNARNITTTPMAIWENHSGSIVRCILGLWLILGTHGVVALLRRHGGKWRENTETGKPE